MAQLRYPNPISTVSMAEFDELDHVPLLSRRKFLLSSKLTTTSCIDVVVKKEEEEDKESVLSFPSACSVGGGIDQQLALKQSHDDVPPFGVTSEVIYGDIQENSSANDGCSQEAPCGQDFGRTGDCNSQRIPTNVYTCPDQIICTGLNADVAELEKVGVSTLYKSPAFSGVPTKVKVENSGKHVFSSLGVGENDFAGVDAPAGKVNTNIPNDFADDDLDHIVLKERQRMLLKRRLLELGKRVVECNSGGMSEDLSDLGAERIKDKTKSVDLESSVTGDEYNEIAARNASDRPSISSVNASSEVNIAESSFTFNQCLETTGYSQVTEATKSINNMENGDRVCLSERTFSYFNSCNGQDDVPGSSSMHASTLQTSVKVKVEPLGNGDLLHSEKNVMSYFSFNIKPVKSEVGRTDELFGVDHMQLQDRMTLLTSGENCELNSSRNFVYMSKILHPALQNSPLVSESAKPIRANCSQKRKKTATDSVETALEEDAPGLLQVLVEQGVSVDEIKLYGETEDDDALDETLNEDSFSELEAVMSKLFFQRNSMLKFAPVRCAKGSKPSYCVACLFSLVEQTRYLQFRKWPVEWGWCRNLQSFIFVFKRHNRLVLERPEYGYATYFFELVDSLPIDWQIKRLVTTMKLTNCGRVNLIENKSLLVGEDLTEGEAKVLMEFGWVPNSGLGTMLNYCDRVIHDRKNEKDTSEWRSKIGKLLVAGYNGGSIILTNNPGNVTKYTSADSPQIKLEL